MLTGRGWSLCAEGLTAGGIHGGAPMRRRWSNVFAVVCLTLLASPTFAADDTRQVVLSGQPASLRVQTPPGMRPSAVVVVASGADGWQGLTRDIGDQLSADGYVVIGLDTKRYLMEATRRAGALPSAAVSEDYLALLRRVHQWFPDIDHVFLLGVSDGGGLALVAAADPRVGAQLTGVVGVETPSRVSLRAPYWNWTSWITHKDAADVSVVSGDYVAAVAPVPVAFIYAARDLEPSLDTTQQMFERGGEPRRLTVIGTERPLFNDAREFLFKAVHDCLAWSAHVVRPLSAAVSRIDGPTAKDIQ